MAVQKLIILSALAAEPSMTCEQVAHESYYVMQHMQEGLSETYVQQYYDEIGKGEALLKVIDHAYQQDVELSKFNKDKAAESFRKNFAKECKTQNFIKG